MLHCSPLRDFGIYDDGCRCASRATGVWMPPSPSHHHGCPTVSSSRDRERRLWQQQQYNDDGQVKKEGGGVHSFVRLSVTSKQREAATATIRNRSDPSYSQLPVPHLLERLPLPLVAVVFAFSRQSGYGCCKLSELSQ